jgi:hypothetical protein
MNAAIYGIGTPRSIEGFAEKVVYGDGLMLKEQVPPIPDGSLKP